MQYFVLKFQNGEREVEKPCLLHKGQEKRLLGKRVTGFNQGGNTEGPISDNMVGSPLYLFFKSSFPDDCFCSIPWNICQYSMLVLHDVNKTESRECFHCNVM